MAYTNFTHCTTQEYTEIIYSQDDRNKAKIWFNDVELTDFGRKCEKITKISRIIPNDGKKIFSLSNFVATELEVILHDVDINDLVDQVKISIGTVVGSDSLGDIYEFVPLGIFNIQDTPVVNDNKITLKLRDNRVKFDFNYNAKPLIDMNGGSATKRQILEDICTKAGVQHDISSFEFENDTIGIYDDTIKANVYISYLAEQCGKIATIDRLGKLIFVDLTNLYTWRIPRSILPSPFKVETQYQIKRVCYESGIIKYESSNDETLDTLYLNANNPYIDRQAQIDYIFGELEDFTLDSITTQKMLGNPAIDPYDIIEIYDDRDVSEPVIARTLANNIYTFNGKHGNTFQTTIGKEQRKENVSKNSESYFRNWAKTSINNLEGSVEIQTGKLQELEDKELNDYNEVIEKFNDYALEGTVETLQTSVTQLQTDTYTKIEVQQIANGTGVDGVTVSAVVSTEATFDKDGLHYSKTDAPTNSTIDYKGLEVDDNNSNELLFAGYDDTVGSATYGSSIVRTDNLTVNTYLQCANGYGRFEQYTDSNSHAGVGFFLMK